MLRSLPLFNLFSIFGHYMANHANGQDPRKALLHAIADEAKAFSLGGD